MYSFTTPYVLSVGSGLSSPVSGVVQGIDLIYMHFVAGLRLR